MTETNRWLVETGGAFGPDYAQRFEALAASGRDVHGEADFCDRLLPRASRVVDAGCGTGRRRSDSARAHRVAERRAAAHRCQDAGASRPDERSEGSGISGSVARAARG